MLAIRHIFTDKTFLVTLVLAVAAMQLGSVTPGDVNWRTLWSLLALIILVTVYERLHVFEYLAQQLLKISHNRRQLLLFFYLLAFAGSMLVTNDIAILTLLPIFFQISTTLKLKPALPTSLITIYANLGGALTPIGNPQNLYLLSYYHLNFASFMQMTGPIWVLSALSFVVVALVTPSAKIGRINLLPVVIDFRHLWILLLGTAIVLLAVLKILPLPVGVAVAVGLALISRSQSLEHTDYSVILVLLNFFIIVGALSRWGWVVTNLEASSKTIWGTFLTTVGISQVISNVPGAVLMSRFTSLVQPIYLGATVGSFGTVVASLANLLAVRQYYGWHRSATGSFIRVFTYANLVFLLAFGGLIVLFQH
ncbi:SLC13 family permease [Leuconostocaceae bacterium ESL0723]|nr:SLC13 family permease [Leuconostocaceae bacterium ESL0723]